MMARCFFTMGLAVFISLQIAGAACAKVEVPSNNVLSTAQLVSWCEQVPLISARDLGNTQNNIANAAACLGYLQGWLDTQIFMHKAYILLDNCQLTPQTPQALADLFIKSFVHNPGLKNKPVVEAVNFALLSALCRVNSP